MLFTPFLLRDSYNVTPKNYFVKPTQNNPYNQTLKTKYDSLNLEAQLFKDLCKKNGPQKDLIQQYTHLQKSFRKIQYLIEYINQEAVKKYINGPPLPWLEPNIPTVRVMEPKGLQVIDEMLYSDETLDHAALVEIAEELFHNIQSQKSSFLQNQILEADIKRAIFEEIIRVYSLYVTGFDTPGSLTGISNAMWSLNAIATDLELWFPNEHSSKFTLKAIIGAINFLENNSDFNSFDRVNFYREYVRTIMYHLQNWKVNDLPLHYRNQAEIKYINYASTEIFSKDFFNIKNYSNLPDHQYGNKDLIQLGKRLFNDPILSLDGKMSCASCHKAENGFADGLKTSQTNQENRMGQRNTPTIINSILSKGFFYDLREVDPLKQIAHVVVNDQEFNTDFINIMDKLQNNPQYKSSFQTNFKNEGKSDPITKHNITVALTAYVSSIVDFNSSFDSFMRKEISTIDPLIVKGYNLFTGKAACATCHFIPSFSGLVPPHYKENESEVLGVPEKWNVKVHQLDSDPGRYNSGRPGDQADHFLFSFKTTTVRNIEKTAPYMHNGVFSTLEELMEFYNEGGGAGIGLTLEHQTLSDKKLDLTEDEKKAIIAFMKSLNGNSFYE